MTKIYIASDHASYNEKNSLSEYIQKEFKEHEVIDLGPFDSETVNYAEYAITLVNEMDRVNDLGILLCGSGIGMSMAANRFSHIRAALCRNEQESAISKQHNNSNVLCLGGRITPIDEMKQIFKSWVSASFEEGRHMQRIETFNEIGE